MAPETPRPEESSPFAGLVRGRWPAPVLCASLLVLVALDGRDRSASGDPIAHHDRVRRLADRHLPWNVGEWSGSEEKTPQSAVALLKPNVLVNRTFVHGSTGERATLLFVQCSDARDLIGHYPPVCYPANGLTLDSEEERDWDVDGRRVTGKRYRFSDRRISIAGEVVVDNFMVLPTGGIGRDMESVGRVAKDRRLRNFGAAEVQVLTSGMMSDERRDEVVRTLLAPAMPVFEALRVEERKPRPEGKP